VKLKDQPSSNTGSQRQDLAYWLAVHRTPGLNGSHFIGDLPVFSDPRHLFERSREGIHQETVNPALAKRLQKIDWHAVDSDLEWLSRPGNHIIPICDRRYPFLLQQIPDPPAVIYVQGNPAILGKNQLSIVGSRNPTPGGVEIAQQFAYSLSAAELTITSGMALGIDAAGHRGALQYSGITIAVVGTGLNQIYPRCHRQLAEQILAKGAIVSEYPPDYPPRRNQFPRRNRLISGLSLGTLVVEAGASSGSLITAHFSAQYGREVFAIPGSIHNPLARGCHKLIQEGAKLTERVDDIFVELPGLAIAVPPAELNADSANAPALDNDQQNVLNCLAFGPLSVDAIVDQCRLTAEYATQILLALELLGHVSSAPGGLYCRTKERT